MDPKARTAAATAARVAAHQRKLADRLRAAGWVCVPPDHPNLDAVKELTR